MSKIMELKALLKEKAAYIKGKRIEARDLKQKGQGYHAHEIHRRLVSSSQDYRYHHIAYCELRGKTRDQIEKPKVSNMPYEYAIAKIKEAYAWSQEEIDAYNERRMKRETLRTNQA